ncbi:MAG: hypothetical protein PCFJNLEI_00678 [Verrucomicrobiae bacterium]|nr:hypothetical protein [Verrucomicrobiae bacterium]
MKKDQPTNLAASVHNRLVNYARQAGTEAQLVFMRYGLERLLYRLCQSGYVDDFVVKGAMLFWVWTGEQYRPTKDLDLMTARVRTAEQLETIFMSVCTVPVEADGLVFTALSVKVEEIREEDVYGGMRVTLEARLGRAKIPLQVDIGFGDAITPKAAVAEFPALLAMPAPRLAMYPRETVVAEKFETLVKLGLLNSRMKDFWDIQTLARDFAFDGETLTSAIRATFKRRRTALPAEIPLGLSDGFATDAGKQTQWRAFVKRSRLKDPDFTVVVRALRDFLMPPTMAARDGKPFRQQWPKGGPWTVGQ